MPFVARWSVPFFIAGNVAFNNVGVSAVGGPDAGEFVVTWTVFNDSLGLGDGNGFALYGQMYNQLGTPQGSPFLVNLAATSTQEQPVVVSLNATEGFAVVYHDLSRLGTGFGTDGRLRFFDGDGLGAPGEFVVNAGTPTETAAQDQLSAARGEAFGLVFTTWTDNSGAPNGDGADIRGALFNIAGAFVSDFRITTTATLPGENGLQAQSNVASLPQTGFVVTWADNVPAGSAFSGGGSAIRGQVFDFLGAPVGGQFDVAAVANNTTTFASYPVSAGFNTGATDFVTAWVQDDDVSNGIDLNVYARTFTVDGFGNVVGGTAFVVSQTTSANQSQVVITPYEGDRFIAVWTQQVPFEQPDIRARMFDSSGNPLTDEFIVVPEDTLSTTYDGTLASITVLDDTIDAHPLPRFVITWRDGAGNAWGQIFSPAASELLNYDWFGGPSGETYTAQYDELRLAGNDGNDTLTGRATDDVISGGNGTDTLFGRDGGDTLDGGGSNDTLEGEEGDDTLIGGGGADILRGGNGTDTASYASDTAAMNINMATNVAQGGSSTGDTFNSIENVIGGSGNDTITGTSFANVLDGGNGNDTLNGGNGNDTLNGGENNDTLNGGGGGDSLNGGNGLDTASYADQIANLNINLFAGTAAGGNATGDSFNSIENVTTGSGNDTITGSTGNNVLNGGGGNDTINGGDGNDTLVGGDGNDTMNGGVGADSFNGGAGGDRVTYADQTAVLTISLTTGTGSGGTATGDTYTLVEHIAGGSNNDTLTGSTGNNILDGNNGNDIINGGNGTDTLNGGEGNDRLSGGADADTINGGNGSDTVVYSEQTGNIVVNLTTQTVSGGTTTGDTISSIESIVSGSGSDTLTGSGVNNVIDGGAGADTINGEAANDTLVGGAGNDTITGGLGTDTLTGGLDNDTFVYANGWGVDTITDFSTNDLEDIDLAALTNITDFNDLLANHVRETAGVLEIFDGANVIRLTGYTLADIGVGSAISANDFLF